MRTLENLEIAAEDYYKALTEETKKHGLTPEKYITDFIALEETSKLVDTLRTQVHEEKNSAKEKRLLNRLSSSVGRMIDLKQKVQPVARTEIPKLAEKYLELKKEVELTKNLANPPHHEASLFSKN